MRSFVKLLVIGLIVIVGGGLLAAGIVRLRQAADRSHCQSTLRIVEQALQDYHDTNLLFPQATWTSGALKPTEPFSSNPPLEGTLPPEKRLSWYVSVLPYLEQLPLRMDLNRAWDAPENCPVRWSPDRDTDHPHLEVLGPMGTFCCPANPNRTGPELPAVTHYVGIAGLGQDAPYLPAADPQAGIFGYDRHTSLKEIQRGTGHTIMVMETAWQNGPWTAGGFPTTRGLVPGGQPLLGPGGQFGGTHAGGGWAAFADGSVRFLSESMSPQVLEDMATIRGGSLSGPAREGHRRGDPRTGRTGLGTVLHDGQLAGRRVSRRTAQLLPAGPPG